MQAIQKIKAGWENGKEMALGGKSRKGLSRDGMKNILVATILVLFLVIILAHLVPMAWGSVTNASVTVENQSFTLSDVPGGQFYTSGLFWTLFILGTVVGLVVVTVLRYLDLI